MSVKCQGIAWRSCSRDADGVLYRGYPDGYWEAANLCNRCFFITAAYIKDETVVPDKVEFHALSSVGPTWTRRVK